MIDDIEAFEQSYRALENSLGDYNVGQAIRLLSGIDPADDRWDTVIEHEVRRVVQLHAAHYTQFQKGNTIVIGRNPVAISDSRDELMATIGFVQGATFVIAALHEQGRLKDEPA
jgi:hypothetical protein